MKLELEKQMAAAWGYNNEATTKSNVRINIDAAFLLRHDRKDGRIPSRRGLQDRLFPIEIQNHVNTKARLNCQFQEFFINIICVWIRGELRFASV